MLYIFYKFLSCQGVLSGVPQMHFGIFHICSIIYKKIDKDGDGQVTEEELTNWIKYVQTRYIRQDTDRQWKDHHADNESKITWESYKQRTYSNIDGRSIVHCLVFSPV